MFAALRLHVTLAVPPKALPPVTLTRAVAEAAALWAPYGVTVDAAGQCGLASDDTTRLTVAVVCGRRAHGVRTDATGELRRRVRGAVAQTFRAVGG